MPAVALQILKYLFLALIFLFLARAVRAMYVEISGLRSPRSPAPQASASPSRAGRPPDKVAVIVSGAAKAPTYELGDELIVGRSDKCNIPIGDTYASQVHARVFRANGQFYIEDMGSTNGTYLNSRKVTSPTPVNRGDKVRIGKTELEFRR